MLKRLYRQDGLTLVELSIATIILAMTGFVLYFMFNQGWELSMEQDHKQLVFELAKKRMAIYKHVSDAGILEEGEFSGEEELPIPANLNEDESDDEGIIVVDYVVTVDQVGTDEYAEVKVYYSWTERSGRSYELTLVDAFPF